MTAALRLARIRDLLAAGVARTQEDIRAHLSRRGLEATQTTISRDLRRLGAIKTARGYALPVAPGVASPAAAPALDRALHNWLVSVHAAAGGLVVLRTGPGKANALAAEIDAAPPPGVAGTIAGDDTIFVAARSSREAPRLSREFRRRSGRN